MGEFNGKVALVTGAAGGIGKATVEALVAEGAAVVASDLDASVASLERDLGEQVATTVTDISVAGAAEATVQLALDRFGRLDVLVNNAGRFLLKPIEESTDDDWDELMTVNAKAAFRHLRAALPHLEAHGEGAIVNVASVSAVLGLPAQAVYCATKGAILQLTRVVAVEYAQRGVRANAVAPGATETSLLMDPLRAQPDGDELVASIAADHPLGRMAQSAEIANCITFLASPRASFVTGSLMMVDGGLTTI